MTDWREELIEKIAKAAWESDGTHDWKRANELLRKLYLREARAALEVAEPVIREQADAALREELEALKKFEREKWTGWAAAIREGGSNE